MKQIENQPLFKAEDLWKQLLIEFVDFQILKLHPTNEKLKLTFMEAMKQNWQIGLFFHLSIYNDEIMQLNLKSESILKAIKEERTQAIAKVYKEGAPNYLLARCDAGMCANQAE